MVNGEQQVKVLSCVVVGFLFLTTILELVATNGGAWSESKTTIHEKLQDNSTITTQTTATWGLSGYILTVPYFINGVFIPYTDARDNAHSFSVRVDFEDLIDAGRGTTAFLVLALLATPVALAMHLVVWPARRKWGSDYTVPVTVVSGICLLLTMVMWTSIGHRSSRHVSTDLYPDVMPEVWHGSTFRLIAGCFSLVLISLILSVYIKYYLLKDAKEVVVREASPSDAEKLPLHADSSTSTTASDEKDVESKGEETAPAATSGSKSGYQSI